MFSSVTCETKTLEEMKETIFISILITIEAVCY